eukprot:Trichotokara_eunicae@DN5291_c0_g1_i1.p1
MCQVGGPDHAMLKFLFVHVLQPPEPRSMNEAQMHIAIGVVNLILPGVGTCVLSCYRNECPLLAVGLLQIFIPIGGYIWGLVFGTLLILRSVEYRQQRLFGGRYYEGSHVSDSDGMTATFYREDPEANVGIQARELIPPDNSSTDMGQHPQDPWSTPPQSQLGAPLLSSQNKKKEDQT